MKSKEQQTPTSKRLNPRLTGSTGIEKKRGRRKESALFRPTRPRIGEDWKKKRDGPVILNQLAVLHDLGAKLAQNCPYGP
jgi:hypothetical protein